MSGLHAFRYMKKIIKKRIIPVFLVFVMLLGMLPTVAFAADPAEPAKDSNDVYQIGDAANLLWFQQQVSSGQTSINAVLTADIDLSTVCGTETGSWISIPAYAGTFDGQGHKISNLYISDATVAKQGLFAALSKQGVVQNIGVVSSGVSMTTAKNINNANAAVLVGQNEGSIINCYVAGSTVTTRATATAKAAAICGNNSGTVINCYSLGNTITETKNKPQIGGICGYTNGSIENCYVVNTTLVTSATTNVGSISGANSGGTTKNCYYLSTGTADDTGIAKEDNWFKSDEAINALGTAYFVKDTDDSNSGYPELTFASFSLAVDKSALEKALTDLALPGAGYYTEADRWNGTKTSEKGFWTDLQEIVKPAQDILSKEDAAQSEIDTQVNYLTSDEITKKVQAAIDNLIPTTQVNATVLYEAVQSASALSENPYTSASWEAFARARGEAETMLDALYDENGNATAVNRGPDATGDAPEGAVRQEDVDAAAAALTQAQENLLKSGSLSEYQETAALVEQLLSKLIVQANEAVEADYTSESWESFRTALDAAKKAQPPVFTGLKTDVAAAEAYQKVYDDLYNAYYYELTTDSEFTVHLEASDADSARSGKTAYGVTEEAVKLDAGARLSELLEKYDITKDKYWSAVIINGILLDRNYLKSQTAMSFGTDNPILHPGDEVCFIQMMKPQAEYPPTIYPGTAYPWNYLDCVKQTHFVGKQEKDGFEAEAGVEFTVELEQISAYLGIYDGSSSPASGMTLFISDKMSERGSRAETQKLMAEGSAVETDAEGRASLTLYSEGWYLLQAYDLNADVMGDVPNGAGAVWKKGEYHSVVSGASVWVHVGASSEADAVKSRLKAALDEVYAAYPETYFRSETWEELQTAYDTAVTGIDSAASTGDAYDAQQTGIVAIRKIQSDTTAENTKNLTTFRTTLSKLPDDTGLITASVGSVVKELIACYNSMSNYQRRQLTGAELARYNEIAAAAEAGLPEAKNYSLTLNVEGDTEEATAALKAMVDYLKENTADQDTNPAGTYGGGSLEQSFVFQSDGRTITSAEPLDQIRIPLDVDYAAYFHVRDAENHSISGEGWTIKDENLSFSEISYLNYSVDGDLTVLINDVPYEVKSITYDGLDSSDAAEGFYAPLDYSTYRGKDAEWPNIRFYGAYQKFDMPYNDVTVTITWGPANDNVYSAKTAALSRLKTLYDTLGDKADAAYNEGVTAINAAVSADALEKAYQAAVVAMRAAADDYGRVQVIVENTTFTKDKWPEGKKYWDGTLVDTTVSLTKESTMMSCIVEALEDHKVIGAEKNYISEIDGLAEFSGGSKSGWMGTLNDWFVNAGFANFTVDDGRLSDGDIIRVMYTVELGKDLGSIWGDSNTTLKSLTVEGGTMEPAFSSDALPGSSNDYMIMINGETASLTITPTAANKNFIVKTFLNQKITTNTEGSSFYKRTETIPVRAGDRIYVGCGESAWSSMNNQSENSQSNGGTWYVLEVVDATAGVQNVITMIRKLPDIGKLTLSNYESCEDGISSVKDAYDGLSPEQQSQVTNADKLDKLVRKLNDLRQLKALKDALSRLPAADQLDPAQKEEAGKAVESYDNLSDAMKLELTIDESDKVQALREKLASFNNAPTRKTDVPENVEESIPENTAWIIDLSTIFEDADDDPLTYQVKIDNADYVSAEENYSYTPDSTGNTTLVFKASDGKADSETYTVKLTAVHLHSLQLVPEKPATCTEDGNSAYYICTSCGKWYADKDGAVEITDHGSVVLNASGHDWADGDDWSRDETNHWRECSRCHVKKDEAAHDFGEDDVCDTCGFDRSVPHTHSYGSEWQSDSASHWKQCSCGNKTEITDHSFKWVIDQEATETQKGSGHKECTICGYRCPAEEIPAAGSTISPSNPEKDTQTAGSSDNVQTGDNKSMIFWIFLLLVSGFGVIGAGVYAKRKKHTK